METLSVLASRKKSSVTRLTRNSKIFKSIISAIHQKKGEQIISLDLRKIPEAVTDFFVICQATSNTQVKAIADSIQDFVRKNCDETPYKHEGQQTSQWILIDYVNIVVHIMQPDARKFYRLEEMWSDAALTEHNEG
ncbi:MAG: ribosome silencing factor [Panacibacter sp.]